MNHVTITCDKYGPTVWYVELTMTREAEANFQTKVFPFLFDGRTSGAVKVLPDSRVQYRLLVYDETIVQTLKHLIFNAQLADNGQLN